MFQRKRFQRPNKRDDAIQFNAAERFVAGAHDIEAKPLRVILPKRQRQRPEGVDIDAVHKTRDLEGPVIAAVGELLAIHPGVLFAVRQNSGALPYSSGNGRIVPVWFYKFARRPEPMTVVDYWGFLVTGKPFGMECKKPSWTKPSTERETRQLAFMQMILKLGGVSGFVRSADEAKALLPWWLK